jgi:hypothetical protein
MIGSGAANVPACDTKQTSLVKRFARARRERASERQMPRAISRKGFLRLGGVGLAGAALVGAADCSGSLSCNKVVKFQTIAEETSMQERAALEIQVDRFEDQHPKYALEREVTLADEASTVSNTIRRCKPRCSLRILRMSSPTTQGQASAAC